ncbi:MAG: helix-turn-helix transcriptional regulator [Selenomonadaceae bacterium]|nr:helix-turn-helix transcriptional regulator [Selenomonadaceae bacterium]
MRLWELRKKKGFTQKELAETLHISPMSVYFWEKGITYPRREKIKRLANIFECSQQEILNVLEETEMYNRSRSFADKEKV